MQGLDIPIRHPKVFGTGNPTLAGYPIRADRGSLVRARRDHRSASEFGLSRRGYAKCEWPSEHWPQSRRKPQAETPATGNDVPCIPDC